MLRRNLAGAIALVASMSTIACSEQSPVSPPDNLDARNAGLVAQAVPGCYELSFLDNSLQPVATRVVGEELILKAHVHNCSGVPAQRGSVTFQYCSLKGLPPNDITRADEAPSASMCGWRCYLGPAAHAQSERIWRRSHELWTCLDSQNYWLPLQVFVAGEWHRKWRERPGGLHMAAHLLTAS
jgi:hypothetical protein